MEYRVEQLAAAAGVRVDTVRFYQARGLLPAPKRVKRHALYSEVHLARLRQIRRYQAQGLSLAVIGRLLRSRVRGSAADALLEAVADQAGERTLTRAELAERTGVPEALLVAVEHAGLLRPVTVGGQARFGEADVQMARAGMDILAQGFPLDRLLEVAVEHAIGAEQRALSQVQQYEEGSDAEIEQVLEVALDLTDVEMEKEDAQSYAEIERKQDNISCETGIYYWEIEHVR